MIDRKLNRRNILTLAGLSLLAACQAGPRGPQVAPPPPTVVGAASTWQTIVDAYGSWADVLDAFPTWQEASG